MDGVMSTPNGAFRVAFRRRFQSPERFAAELAVFVDTGHRAVRTEDVAHQAHHFPWTATDVKAAHPRSDVRHGLAFLCGRN